MSGGCVTAVSDVVAREVVVAAAAGRGTRDVLEIEYSSVRHECC